MLPPLRRTGFPHGTCDIITDKFDFVNRFFKKNDICLLRAIAKRNAQPADHRLGV